MDERQALEIIDQQLGAALSGVVAPHAFAAAVRRRLPRQRVSWLPELLDSLGYLALLAATAVLLVLFVPANDPYWPWDLAGFTVLPALCFGVRSLRALAE